MLTKPFKSLAIDLVGPLPKGKGDCWWILTAICMASRWPEAVPLKEISAKSVAHALIEFFSHTALPFQILSDRGGQFTGRLMWELCSLLQVSQLWTTAYHPQTNGCVERMHGTLKNMLMKAVEQGQD